MKYSLVTTEEPQDFLRHLPPALKKKIKQALQDIVENPSCGKALQDELKGLFSYKVGQVRIIYRVHDHSIHLITIGPRKTIYQKVLLEIRRHSQ
jgi:mRNA-degrading endonuclease RelE of RelBE toxin-antitoxin system